MQTYYATTKSPLGQIQVIWNDEGITHIDFEDEMSEPQSSWKKVAASKSEAIQQLNDYFAGKRTDFDLKLSPTGTEFQNQVWQALLKIPYGTTTSYGALAKQLGRPKASRAVGAANGQNPLAIVVPCHRVIGSNGKLTGYAGGLHRKEALLNLEQK